ncbi:MAG TPA: hypothetical protein VFA20_20335 [Myxococcaceae bacterium]|nr:hypothetical protein [Myxococcaceae bacterium]
MATRGEPIGGTLAIEVELRKEKASALRRVAGRLETSIADLQALEAKMPPPGSPDRARFVERHRALRAEAEQHRWYFIIQREAMGLLHHGVVDEMYPIPRPIR